MFNAQAPSPIPARRTLGKRLAIGAALLLVTLVYASGWPLLRAMPVADDWGFIALARHLSSPLDLYLYDHSSSYFYRPNAMLLWWLTGQAFGADFAAHYAINTALQSACALVVGVAAYNAGARTAPALALAALFAVHPTAIGTAAWLADRFDLSCTLATLGAIAACERALKTGAGRWLVVLLAAVAAGCKETAILLLPALTLRLAYPSERSWTWRLTLLAGAAAPFAAMLMARSLLLEGVALTTGTTDMLATVSSGTWAWLRSVPTMTLLAIERGSIANALAVLAMAASGAAVVAAIKWEAWRPLAPLMALAWLPGLVQSPVAGAVLATDAALLEPVNFRFFHLALAALLSAVAVAYSLLTDAKPRPKLAGVALATCLIAVLSCAVAARAVANAWADRSLGAEGQLARAAGLTLAQRSDWPPRCRVYLLGSFAHPGNFYGFADAVVKAQIAPDSTLASCVVMAERAPWFQLLPEHACGDDGWQPLEPRLVQGRPLLARRIGDLCVQFLAVPERESALTDPNGIYYAFDAGGALHRISREAARRAWIELGTQAVGLTHQDSSKRSVNALRPQLEGLAD